VYFNNRFQHFCDGDNKDVSLSVQRKPDQFNNVNSVNRNKNEVQLCVNEIQYYNADNNNQNQNNNNSAQAQDYINEYNNIKNIINKKKNQNVDLFQDNQKNKNQIYNNDDSQVNNFNNPPETKEKEEADNIRNKEVKGKEEERKSKIMDRINRAKSRGQKNEAQKNEAQKSENIMEKAKMLERVLSRNKPSDSNIGDPAHNNGGDGAINNGGVENEVDNMQIVKNKKKKKRTEFAFED